MKLLLAAILLASSSAQACELSLVTPAQSALKNPVQVKASLAGDNLIVNYSVSTPTINAMKVLGPGQYPYMYDVVEVFMTFSDTGYPYYEFEVSPYNQTFQVKIAAHKKFQDNANLVLASTAKIQDGGGWKAEMKIPLKQFGWDGDPKKIRGNFYSALGRGQTRSYWSAFMPKQKKIDFHQPQFFQPLLQCE